MVEGLLQNQGDVGLIPRVPVIEPGVMLCAFPVNTKKAEAGEPWSQWHDCLACLVSPKAFRDFV